MLFYFQNRNNESKRNFEYISPFFKKANTGGKDVYIDQIPDYSQIFPQTDCLKFVFTHAASNKLISNYLEGRE